MSATTAHHGLPAHEVVLLLESDPYHGLSDGEAAQRLERFGPNTLAVVTRASLLARILRQFHHPLIYVLLVAGTITAGLKEFVDAAVIFGVVVINAIVGFIQESKAEAALQGLRSMVHTHAKVVREGHEHTMPSEELVPGDLVLLAAGDKVPADLRLVRQTGLSVNESALTGESTPVHKDEVALPEGTPVADRRNIAYSGTLVTAGHGAGIVVATGAETELGEIHRLVGAAEVVATPLTAKLAWFSKFLTIASWVWQRSRSAWVCCAGKMPSKRSPLRSRWRSGQFPKSAHRRDHHLGHRHGPDGQAPRGHSTSTRGGNAGQHHGHLRRQDRNADRESDDGPVDLDTPR